MAEHQELEGKESEVRAAQSHLQQDSSPKGGGICLSVFLNRCF